MQNEAILERIEGLRGRKAYEEKKAAKLGFKSLYEYFEDKIAKEARALEAHQADKTIEKKAIKDELRTLTSAAFEKDIFGAPTFVVNNKIFWGQDRLEYALDEYNS